MEAEVGLGGERLSKSSGSPGVTRSLWAGHSPRPGCAHLPVRWSPAGTLARPGWPRGGHRMAVCRVCAGGGTGGGEAGLRGPRSYPRTLAQASVRPGWLSGGEVGTLHGVEPVDGVPHAGLQGAHVRGAEEAVTEAG